MTDPTAATPGAEWDAQAYDRLANPMQTWGEAILGRMDLRGDETALDLGCGSGRLTEHLLRRLPRGRVIAIDRSANMLAAAREHLEPQFQGRVEYVQNSLELIDLDQVADLAFSNAALHWVRDHPALFAAIFRALKAGGWLVAQCGGGPNILRVRQRAQGAHGCRAVAPVLRRLAGPVGIRLTRTDAGTPARCWVRRRRDQHVRRPGRPERVRLMPRLSEKRHSRHAPGSHPPPRVARRVPRHPRRAIHSGRSALRL